VAPEVLRRRFGACEERVDRVGERPLVRDSHRNRPRVLEQLAVAQDVRETEIREPRLSRAEQGAAAARLRDAESVTPVAETIGRELGWSSDRVRDEAEAWVEVARAEGVDPARDVSLQ